MALLSDKDIGLDVNAGGSDKEPHLNFAAAEGHAGIVKLLLAHGANPDDGPLNGVTPLLSAVYHGRTAVAQVLTALNINKPETVRLDGPDGDGTHTADYSSRTRIRRHSKGSYQPRRKKENDCNGARSEEML